MSKSESKLSSPHPGIFLLLGCLRLGGSFWPAALWQEVFQKLFPESKELQTTCWGDTIPTTSTRNQIQLHLKSITIDISFKHTCRLYYKIHKKYSENLKKFNFISVNIFILMVKIFTININAKSYYAPAHPSLIV